MKVFSADKMMILQIRTSLQASVNQVRFESSIPPHLLGCYSYLHSYLYSYFLRTLIQFPIELSIRSWLTSILSTTKLSVRLNTKVKTRFFD